MRHGLVLVLALATACSCGPGPGVADGGTDAGPADDYFGTVTLKCFEYVEGDQPKASLDLGVVAFNVDAKGAYCPAAKTAEAVAPDKVYIVRYYQTGIPVTDYFFVDGDRLKRCRRDYGTFTGNTYKYKGEGLTIARRPVIDNERLISSPVTEVRDPQNRILYETPHQLTVDTLAAPDFKTPSGTYPATRFIFKEVVAGDGGSPDAAAGTVVYQETRYFVPGTGWVGLEMALDDPGGAIKRYRLQSIRIIASETEALQYPCGGPRPDAG